MQRSSEGDAYDQLKITRRYDVTTQLMVYYGLDHKTNCYYTAYLDDEELAKIGSKNPIIRNQNLKEILCKKFEMRRV